MSEPKKHAEIVGPFVALEYSYAVIDGYKVPYIKLVTLKGENDGRTEIHLDNCCWIIDDHELDVVLHLLSKAMAVAAGYNCHGEHSEPFNPFKVRMTSLG